MRTGHLRKAPIRDQYGISRYHAESSHQQTGRGLRRGWSAHSAGNKRRNEWQPTIHPRRVGWCDDAVVAVGGRGGPDGEEEEVVKEGCAEVAG